MADGLRLAGVVGGLAAIVTPGLRPGDQRQEATDRFVHTLLADLAGAHCGDQLLATDPGRPGHLQIQTGLQ